MPGKTVAVIATREKYGIICLDNKRGASADTKGERQMTEKIAVILGTTRGIGRALAGVLHAALGTGSVIYATARNAADGERLAAELAREGVPARPLRFDLADPAHPGAVAASLKEQRGGVDIVIQNGAYMPRSGVSAADDARPMIAAYPHGTLRVLRAFLPHVPSPAGQRRRADFPRARLSTPPARGVTLTDATRDFMGTALKPEKAQTPEQAALGLARLALLPVGTPAPSGELVRHGTVLRFGD